MGYDEMRAFQVREETGELPDEMYWPSEEDAQDPDHHEVADMVREQYAMTNAARAERRLRDENEALRALLRANNIDPDEVNR